VTLDPSTLDTVSLPFSQILHLLRGGGPRVARRESSHAASKEKIDDTSSDCSVRHPIAVR
jgi:hypothetical protein